ncbi:hypothetical protein C6500_05440 [Candidatus Poribacteria bacterium]|nr:MAG: hypothetical protein C6500_05440 [Candidatus Poribacteria bacterium]
MQWNLKRLLVAAVALAVLWTPIIQAQQTEILQSDMQTLRWKNGDALPGNLLESTPGMIRWSSPYFSDDLVVDIGVLDSIVFPKRSAPATEAFRIGTVSGDIWIADIDDSDEETFLFSSARHGRFRVNREAIYTLERRVHPNLIFDGSQLTNWEFPKRDANQPILLFGGNALPDWYADRGGHPRTDKVKAKIFHALDWPQRFEIDLELASATRPPGFVFALGKNLYEALRLETWVNELVVVQGTLFEPVLTIQPDRRNFRLRLAYDGDPGVLEVFDFAGNLLLKLDGVGQTVKESGPYVYNRGQNLTVRRLRVYRQPIDSTKQQVDPSKPRVHMMNGQVVYGKLFVEKESTYVLDEDGNRYDIDIQQIDRVVQPGAAFVEMEQPVALTYPDGAVLRGKIAQVNPDSVLLQTAFANEPIECVFAGASLLRVELSGPKNHGQIEDEDRLFHPSGNLRGRVLFDVEDKESKMNEVHQSLPFIRWKPIGASEAVRLAKVRRAHIERNNRRASKAWPFDTSRFRHILHLKSGEIIPCQISSYDEKTVGFQSPFISAHLMDSADVKALEFSGRTHANYIDRIHSTNSKGSYTVIGHGRNIKIDEIEWNIEGNGKKLWVEGDELPNLEVFLKEGGKVDVLKDGEVKIILNGRELELNSNSQDHQLDVKLERALTVPRFSRDTPPNHILVAENGDMKRGKLLGFNGEMIQFDSKLRQFSVPIDRVARVVDVSKEAVSNQQRSRQLKNGVVKPKPSLSLTNNRQLTTDNYSEVSIRLTDGSILIFEPLEIKDDALLGHSSIYGEISVPIESIQHLYLGDTTMAFEAAFAAWVVRPAKEPVFGDHP